jgi:hypothetical protein
MFSGALFKEIGIKSLKNNKPYLDFKLITFKFVNPIFFGKLDILLYDNSKKTNFSNKHISSGSFIILLLVNINFFKLTKHPIDLGK